MKEANLHPWGGLDEILREKNEEESERLACEIWGNPYREEEEEQN